jgi:endonuclease/exonuclease/phosphatase family metal-dependent hydrolase
MRLVTWNLNHRTRARRITPPIVEVLVAIGAQVVVLTEYVAGPSHRAFLDALGDAGLQHSSITDAVAGENQLLVVSVSPVERGHLRAPAIGASLPSNVSHLAIPRLGFDLLALRLPDYSREPRTRRACWGWILEAAASLEDQPAILMGDFNTDPNYQPARCGDRIRELAQRGWRHAMPRDGCSYWTPRGHGVRIDHAFVSRHFAVRAANYVREMATHALAGTRLALSDHAALVLDFELELQDGALRIGSTAPAAVGADS